MVSHLFFYQLRFLGLLWLCVMLPAAWPNECPGGEQRPSKPLPPPRKHSRDPQPFPGLTHKPPCAACAQVHAYAPQPPGGPPPRIVPTRGRPRPVDTSRHCCPHPDCASRGWVGWGNLRANGLPTICHPPFVNFSPHLHAWLTTHAACIIAGALTQHGHKHTQQSVTKMA
jgi:hypothetical protein